MVQSFYMAARGLCALDIREKESKIILLKQCELNNGGRYNGDN